MAREARGQKRHLPCLELRWKRSAWCQTKRYDELQGLLVACPNGRQLRDGAFKQAPSGKWPDNVCCV